MVSTEGELRVSPLPRKNRTVLPSGVRNARVDPAYVSHAYARGPISYLQAKLTRAVTYGTNVESTVVDLCVRDFVQSAIGSGWKFGLRRSIDRVVELKRSGASVGEPFDTRYGTYADLVEDVPKHILSLLLEAHILEIEHGLHVFCPLNRAHIKPDSYSWGKISAEKWRAIQANDVLTFMLFNHVFGELVEAGELNHDRIVVQMNALKWHGHVAREMNAKRTVGLDYSDFDETEAAELLYRAVQKLCQALGCSERMTRYLCTVAAYTWAVGPDGRVYEKGGGNPSGQFLTSLLNSIVNDIILTQSWGKALDVDYDEVWGLRSWKIVGDDNLMEAATVEEIRAVSEFITTDFGQVVKLDLCGGDLYPVGAHAPFLSKVTASVGGYTLTLPSEPTRLLTSWQVPDPGEVEPGPVFEGLAQELYGYRIIRDCELPWPIPVPVLSFLEDYDELCAKGWRGVPLQDVFTSRIGLSCC